MVLDNHERKACVVKKSRQVQKCYHYAARKGFLDVCHLILKIVQEKNPKDNKSCTPLHYAARNGHSEVCQLILENVQDKNPKNNAGHTPLNLAKTNGHSAVVNLITSYNFYAIFSESSSCIDHLKGRVYLPSFAARFSYYFD